MTLILFIHLGSSKWMQPTNIEVHSAIAISALSQGWVMRLVIKEFLKVFVEFYYKTRHNLVENSIDQAKLPGNKTFKKNFPQLHKRLERTFPMKSTKI